MVKVMDATQRPFPLHNGKQAPSRSSCPSPSPQVAPPARHRHARPARAAYLLLPFKYRAALEGFFSLQPPPTPTSAPHRPATNLADALGLAGPPTAAPFTAVLEAVHCAPTDTLAEMPVLCPAATAAIQRLLLRRVRATTAVQNPRAHAALVATYIKKKNTLFLLSWLPLSPW